MKRVKFQEGGQARSGINNEPVGQNFRRLLERMTAPSARSEAPAQGPRPQSGQRPQEDRARMAEEAAAQFDAEEQALRDRAAARREARGGTRITNEPVGQRLFGGRPSAPAAPSRPPASGGNFPGETVPPAPRPAAPARPAARPAPRRQAQREMSAEERQAFMERMMREEADREAAARRSERGFFERMGIRRTNETGMEPGTIEQRRNYLGSSGAADTNPSMNKKGGLIKAYREGGAIRQGIQSPKAQEGRAEMAEDVMRRERAREPISDKERKAGRAEAGRDSGPLTDAEKERMRSSGFKKGGMIKPKGHGMKEEAMEMKGGRYRGGMKEEMAEMRSMSKMKKGGAVKAPAKKMKSGGKVAAPKKMMKGGMTSKPKKMMGGGRAMYAKGGMAKGCK